MQQELMSDLSGKISIYRDRNRLQDELNRKVKAPNTFYIQPEILTALKFATTTESTARVYILKRYLTVVVSLISEHANVNKQLKIGPIWRFITFQKIACRRVLFLIT